MRRSELFSALLVSACLCFLGIVIGRETAPRRHEMLSYRSRVKLAGINWVGTRLNYVLTVASKEFLAGHFRGSALWYWRVACVYRVLAGNNRSLRTDLDSNGVWTQVAMRRFADAGPGYARAFKLLTSRRVRPGGPHPSRSGH